MSAGEWQDVDYASVPRKAQRIYAQAFARHDDDRYFVWLIEKPPRQYRIGKSLLTGAEAFYRAMYSTRLHEIMLALG